MPLAPMPAALRSGFPSSVVERVARHGAQFHAGSASGRYAFAEAGVSWEGWFEDWTSLLIKRQWLACEGVDGLAFFALGYDGGALVSPLVHDSPEPAACPASSAGGAEDGESNL